MIMQNAYFFKTIENSRFPIKYFKVLTNKILMVRKAPKWTHEGKIPIFIALLVSRKGCNAQKQKHKFDERENHSC